MKKSLISKSGIKPRSPSNRVKTLYNKVKGQKNVKTSTSKGKPIFKTPHQRGQPKLLSGVTFTKGA